MRVLVTGGAGYIGSVTVEALVAAGHEVDILDDLSTGHRTAAHPDARLHVGSYADTAATVDVLRGREIDAVLHCGARSLVGESVANPARYYRENVAGGVALLDAARTAGVRRVVFSSSAAVYGIPERAPIPEDAPTRPINPYGETKRIFESQLHFYASAYGLRSISLRYFNAAGASERNGEDHDPETHLIPNVLRAAAAGDEVPIFGNDYATSDGTCVRDYIHVEDLARAHLAALDATDPSNARTGGPDGGLARTMNLGSGAGFSVKDVLAAAERVIGRKINVRAEARRPGDPPVLVAAADQARDVLGWQPRRSTLAEMIGSAWSWRERHPVGYER